MRFKTVTIERAKKYYHKIFLNCCLILLSGMSTISKSVYEALKKPLFPLKYERKHGLIFWRERILYAFSFISLYFGFIVLIPSIIASVTNDVISIAVIDVLVYLYVVFLFTSRNLTFKFRVNNLLIIIYFLSVILLLILGPYGAGIIWLFTVPLMAGIFMGLRPAIHAIIVNLLTLIGLGFFIHAMPSSFFRISDYGLDGFIAVSLNFLAINMVFSVSTGVLLDGLNETMKEEEKMRALLEDEKNVMEKLKEKAEASDKIKTSFLTNISHDLRTPLNAILGFTQLLRTKKVNEETLHKYCSIIMAQGESLLRLINDIIDIAKIESDEIAISKENFALRHLLDDIYSFYQNQLKIKNQKNIEIKFTVEKTVPEVIFQDQHRLKQILYNLLGNALKFTYSGHIMLSVKNHDNRSILFGIEDTGIGIPKNKLEIIFERFRQVDESPTKSFGGAGLGLSICKSLIDLLGGFIWVESELDKGTTFYFILPVQ